MRNIVRPLARSPVCDVNAFAGIVAGMVRYQNAGATTAAAKAATMTSLRNIPASLAANESNLTVNAGIYPATYALLLRQPIVLVAIVASVRHNRNGGT